MPIVRGAAIHVYLRYEFNRNMRKFLILIILICFENNSLCAQDGYAERLTIDDGLSQGMIFDIYQTRDGFLWVATKDGLNRFDGYNFKVFSNNPFDEFTLAENTVTALFEDSRGWLWVGTDTKGLDLFDRKTGQFHHFPLNLGNSVLSERVAVIKIRQTADGAIWVLKGGDGLIRIQLPEAWKTGLPAEQDLSSLADIKRFPLDFMQTPGDRILNFDLSSSGQLLVSSHQVQCMIDPINGTFRRVNEGLLTDRLIGSSLVGQGKTDVHWFLFEEKIGLLYNGVFSTFNTPHGKGTRHRILFSTESGNTWLAIGDGLWELHCDKKPDFDKPDLLVPERVTCSIFDSNGNQWVGTSGYGLLKIYPEKKRFHAGASGTSIAGLWRSAQNRYYGKTYSAIIAAFDPLTGKFDEKTAFPDAGNNQEWLLFDKAGYTWLLSSPKIMADGATLSRYDHQGKRVADFPLNIKLSHREHLFLGQNDNIWITLGSCQLIRFNTSSGARESLHFSTLFGDKTAAVIITSFVEDASRTLWIGTQLGLIKGTPNNSVYDFQLIQADPKNPAGLNSNSIACILPDPLDPGGVLWIGTKGGGINRFNTQNYTCEHFTSDNGLPNNVVYGILPDEKKNFWCSTNRGLAKLTPRSGVSPLYFDITAYTAKTGLQSNEFNTFAYFKADNGEMLFGGVNGLNRFLPNELQTDTTPPPPVFIVGLEINHKPASTQSLGMPLEQLRTLELGYNQNNISFEFAALDFTDSDKNRYRYILLGLDEKWVENGANRFAHFSHLPPGRYKFKVQGSDGESGWQDVANPISIIISPPWWGSVWAYLSYFIGLALLAWNIYQAQIRRVKMQEQLAFGNREALRMQVLEQMKTNFFNNITHELRTPLTLIIEPLRQLLKTPASEAWRPNVQLAESNSRKLLSLVNQLLDLAKLESGSMALDLRRADIRPVIRALVESFLPLAEQRGIKLGAVLPSGATSFIFDVEKVESVLNNLISNALKFTPESGAIMIRMVIDPAPASDTLKEEQPISPMVRITVSDTGQGIPANALHKIFDRFYQVDAAHALTGTGLGLSLSKDLAERMGGGLSVESTPGEGSSFTFWLPAREIGEIQSFEQGARPVKLSKKEPLQAIRDHDRPVALIIEDNAELRAFLRQSIADRWQVAEASNGEEGIRKAIDILPDVIISDLMMPEKDGFEVCQALRAASLTAHIPIILLTAKTSIDARIKGLRNGVDDYLTKPFHTGELLARMENLVDIRRKLSQRYGNLTYTISTPASTGQTESFLSAPDREFLRQLHLTLEQHLREETLGTDSLAQLLDINRMQLHRKLKAISNQSASEFIRKYRLERAMSLLKNREGNVKQVSVMVGFGNEKYFSSTFKEHFGLSPSDVLNGTRPANKTV